VALDAQALSKTAAATINISIFNASVSGRIDFPPQDQRSLSGRTLVTFAWPQEQPRTIDICLSAKQM
jgi:hypothetical protein